MRKTILYPKALMRGAVAGILIILNSNICSADKIPGTAYAGSSYYYTMKMDLIKIEFGPSLGNDAIASPIVSFQLPRAYIFFVDYNEKNNENPLTSRVRAKSVNIMLTYPNGLPYSHSIYNYKKSFRVSVSNAAKALRPFRLVAQIRGVKGSSHELAYLSPESEKTKMKRETLLGSLFGLKRYIIGDSMEVYYGSKYSLIRKIQCHRTLDKAHRRHFCRYYVILNNHLIASIDFIDFRLNGGIAFAEERVDLFVSTICRFASCALNRQRVKHQ